MPEGMPHFGLKTRCGCAKMKAERGACMEQIQKLFDFFNTGIDVTTGAVSIAAYILWSLAIFTIAQRRCIKKSWMAWVPVVNVWILGSIADQYRYVKKREVKNNRKILLGLNIVMTALCMVLIILVCVFVVRLVITAGGNLESLIRAALNGNFEFYVPYTEDMATPLLLLMLLLLPMSAVAVVYSIFYFMTLCDVYKSCNPGRSKMFLLFSIFGNLAIPGVEAVFLMLCRNQDLGMPPRKVVVTPVVELPAEAVTEELSVEESVLDEEAPVQEIVTEE